MSANNIPQTSGELPTEITEVLPSDAVSQSTIEVASNILEPAIFNHSLRVYLHAVRLLEKESTLSSVKRNTFFPQMSIDRKLLLVAALFHDSGTTSMYNGHQRFEVEGADAACSHMIAHGLKSEVDLHRVWSAIALHTSPGIAERIDPFSRILRVAVKVDFSKTVRARYGMGDYATEIERYLPRMDIEKVLGDAVVSQAGKILDSGIRIDSTVYPDSEKHPKASWPGILLRAHLENPEFAGVNIAF